MAEKELEEIQPEPEPEHEPEPIQLDLEPLEPEPFDPSDGDEANRSAIHIPGADLLKKQKVQYKRPPNSSSQGAIRCRIFRSKIAVASLEYLENQINNWLDGEDIDVKHVGHVIGIMEGKTPEPNLIVTVWY